MECQRGLAIRKVSVCLSVRLSVKRMYCVKTEEDFFQNFTALHGMQTRFCDENSVCLSVRLSVSPPVKRVLCDKMEKKIGPDIYII